MNPIGRAFIKMHTWLLRKSDGKRFNMGGRVLVLNTVGAKSGKQRANPLMFMEHEDGWVICASAAGADKSPGWWHNLKANPAVAIELGGERIDVEARLITATKVGRDRAEAGGRYIQQFQDVEWSVGALPSERSCHPDHRWRGARPALQ